MKKILVILLAAVIALALAGCAEKESGGQTAPDATTAEETAAPVETAAQNDAAEKIEAQAGSEAPAADIQPGEKLAADKAAAEAGGYQTIQMGNVEMDIPAEWVFDPEAGAEMTHIYRKADGSVEFMIEAMQTASEVDPQVLGQETEEYAAEHGYGDIGYYNDVAGSIDALIIPVDATQHPQGRYQRIYTVGKDRTVVAISFTQDSDDFTEMNKALDTVHFLF